jgi:ribosomal protein L32E
VGSTVGFGWASEGITICDLRINHGFLGNKVVDKGWQYLQIGFGSNKKTRHMMPSGHKAFLVNNTRDVDLLLMHNKTFAAE